MNTDRSIFTAGLLLRLSLGALLLAHAFIALVALGMPACAEALAVQGMPVPAWPLVLVELVAAVVIILVRLQPNKKARKAQTLQAS